MVNGSLYAIAVGRNGNITNFDSYCNSILEIILRILNSTKNATGWLLLSRPVLGIV